MSFIANLDRFVRWFFNVSPTTTVIEPQAPRRRAAAASPRRARAASPKDRRDARPSSERREKLATHAATTARPRDEEPA